MEVPDEDLAECVFRIMSLVRDAGSIPDVPLDLETFMLFSDLESFLQVISSSITYCSTSFLLLEVFVILLVRFIKTYLI